MHSKGARRRARKLIRFWGWHDAHCRIIPLFISRWLNREIVNEGDRVRQTWRKKRYLKLKDKGRDND